MTISPVPGCFKGIAMTRPNHPGIFAAAALAGFFFSSSGHAAARGEAAFAVCAPCHAGDHNATGPALGGLIGRPAGSAPGFRYSRAMKGAAFTWSEEKLDAFIADPQSAVPGNLMPFSGIDDARQRADLIAYIRTLTAAKKD